MIVMTFGTPQPLRSGSGPDWGGPHQSPVRPINPPRLALPSHRATRTSLKAKARAVPGGQGDAVDQECCSIRRDADPLPFITAHAEQTITTLAIVCGSCTDTVVMTTPQFADRGGPNVSA
jgi:hypothetical protein